MFAEQSSPEKPFPQIKRIGQKDIAKSAGVTVAAVSLALRNSPEVSPDLRRRVQELAKQMGYSPDPALQALSRYRKAVLPPSERSTIAFLYAAEKEKSLKSWADTHLRLGILQCAEEQAARLGYHVDFINIGTSKAEQRASSRILKARGICGALLHSNPVLPDAVELDFDQLAVIVLFNEQETPRFHAVGHHHFQGMETVMTQIERRGYTRPLALYNGLNVSNRQWQGALDIFCMHHPKIRPSIVKTDDFWADPRSVIERVDADVLVVSWDNPRNREALTKAGLRIPQDIGYVVLDTDEQALSGAGIFQRTSVAFSVALDLLDRQLQKNEYGIQPNPMQIILDGYWVEGNSLRGCEKSLLR